jgi:hypothetical protein
LGAHLTEKFRIQTKLDGEWKTQKLFSNKEEFSNVLSTAQHMSQANEFDEVRVLEAYENEADEKISYKQKYSSRDIFQATSEEDELPKKSLVETVAVDKGVSGEWICLSEKFASNHPLYGVGGWLSYLYFVLIVNSLAVVISPLLIIDSYSLEVMLEVVLSFEFILPGVAFLVPLYLLYKRSKKFPVWHISIWLIISVVNGADILQSIFISNTPIPPEAALGLGQSGLLTFYTLLSKRVNVTFKHRVRRNELHLVMSRKKIDALKFA